MRKLVSIQTIKKIEPIPDADNIEVAGILDWQAVVKKNQFKVGDKCVYFEIDSVIPAVANEYWKIDPKSFHRNESGRIKTIKLRKVISQGLVLPLSSFSEEIQNLEVGSDITELLNIEKYEPPIPAQIQGDCKGFSWPISKTDEIRVQNNDEYRFIEALEGNPYYISLKLDGTSSSFLIHPDSGEYHVCGRNYSYKESDTHTFWKLSRKYDIENKLREYYEKTGEYLAIQGEIVGPGIQANRLGLAENDLYIFNVIVIRQGMMPLNKSLNLIQDFGLKFVPILLNGPNFYYSVEDCLHLAKGKYVEHFPSAKPSQDREGIVIRSEDGTISFKAINNDFLLKGGD